MPKCPKGKVVNPKTGRCVKRDGALGKKILAARKTAKKAKTPARKVSRKSVKKPQYKPMPVKTPVRKSSRKSAKKPAAKPAKAPLRTPMRRPTTPVRKPVKKMSGSSKSFKLYVMLDGKSSSAVVSAFQKQLTVSNWKGSMGYVGLKDIKVKLVKAYSNYVVLEVMVSAEKFEMEYFESLKQTMADSVSQRINVRAYMSKQGFMN